MRALAGFLFRLVAYGVVLVLALRAAQALWVQEGLDGIPALARLHDDAQLVLIAAPVVLALIGVGPLRLPAVFVAAFLAAAALTAPFALARVLGG